MQVAQQVAVLYCGTRGLLRDVALEKVPEFEHLFLERFTQTAEYETLGKGTLDDAVIAKIEEIAASLSTSLKTA
jgi:F-type H+-transporting ATPase subunit alpha